MIAGSGFVEDHLASFRNDSEAENANIIESQSNLQGRLIMQAEFGIDPANQAQSTNRFTDEAMNVPTSFDNREGHESGAGSSAHPS